VAPKNCKFLLKILQKVWLKFSKARFNSVTDATEAYSFLVFVSKTVLCNGVYAPRNSGSEGYPVHPVLLVSSK
jgi:hypothetical protein